MKLSDFAKPALTGEAPAPPVSSLAGEPKERGNASPDAPQEEQSPSGTETEYFTSITPSGIEVAYSPAPRRHYKLRWPNGWGTEEDYDWREVPSVTSVLGVLEKPQLVWWGMKVGVAGIRTLKDLGVVLPATDDEQADVDNAVQFLTEYKLTVNHQRDRAADRGVNVHGALETWCDGVDPDPADYQEHEQGYIKGLADFLEAIRGGYHNVESELMVGSLQHSYAGRFDLVLTLSKPVEVVVKTYPKRKPKIEEIPAGRYLLDLKTSKGIYNTHYLQLEAYEAAAVECGYAPTDHRGVIHVTADGRYELALNKDWTFEDFLAVRKCYQHMNERSVIQALRDELDAA